MFFDHKVLAVDSLIPCAVNSRTHSDAQVAQIAASIREFGFTNPVLVDEQNNLIAGHGRVMAARKLDLDAIPCIVVTGLDERKRRALVIADNKLALNAGWDEEVLRMELQDLAPDYAELMGFSEDELAELLGEQAEQIEGLTDEDEAPEPPAQPVTAPGDIWLLGKHRLMCGDSTSIDAVDKLMNGKKAALLHADPPYGMGKESDGVANDNLYGNKLDDFQMEWWSTFRTFLEDNASAYIWGNAPELWRLWYASGLSASERLTLRNEITWDKREENPTMLVSGVPLESRRMYHPTERCLFFMLGEQGFNNNSDNYWDGWEPIRLYLETEMKRCGWSVKDLNKITNTQMAGHWVTKSQWGMITAENYAKIQTEAKKHNAFIREHDELKREHDELKREHDELKQDFYATRAYFDNTHDNMTDVWSFSRVTGEDRHGHATPKPVAMMERVMKSSLPKGGLCVEPFGGSGSTLMGAEKTGRICYTMELQEKYCDVIVKRWQDFTGKTATLESDGRTFDEVAKGRLIADAA